MCSRKIFYFAALLAMANFFLPTTGAFANLLVTEISSKSAVDPEDYFELTNTGGTAVDVSGWQFDDESADVLLATPLNGITSIAPGESVIFFQLDVKDDLDPSYDPAAEVTTFRGFWGGLSGVQVGWHAGAGLGKGDAITLFDAADNQTLYLEYGMTTPNQTHAGDWGAGNTDGSGTYETEAAVWVPGSSPQQFVLSEAGVYDSFANTSGEYGSPGTIGVPEPTTFALAALGLIGILGFRRK